MLNSEYLQCSVLVYFADCKGGMADVYFVTPLCHINLYYPAHTNKYRLIFHYVFNHELVRNRQTLSVFLMPRSISLCSKVFNFRDFQIVQDFLYRMIYELFLCLSLLLQNSS